jgi:hypothetical protein
VKEISEDTLNVVNTLKAYSQNGLRKEKDFKYILEYCVRNGDDTLIVSLLQAGAALRNLSVKLADSSLPDDAAVLVQKEFQSQLERFRDLIAGVRAGFGESQDMFLKDLGDRMDEIYLDQTKGNVLNLIDLASDFYLFKTMQTEHRESRKGSENA